MIVARDANVKYKPRPIVPEEQRRAMISALRPVDHAILGDPSDMFRPIEEIRPDIITLGFNQYFNEEKLHGQLVERNIPAQVVRIGRYEGGDLASSRLIVQRIIEARGGDQRSG